jgi:hypothetical protein
MAMAFALNAKTLDYYKIGELNKPVSDFRADGARATDFKGALSDSRRAVHLTDTLRLSIKATPKDPVFVICPQATAYHHS